MLTSNNILRYPSQGVLEGEGSPSTLTLYEIVGGLAPIRKNNRGISGVERLKTPVTGILIVGLKLSLDLPRDGEALEPH
jgi:hypothetical protein